MNSRTLRFAVAVALIAGSSSSASRNPEVVVAWNAQAYEIAYAEDRFLTFKGQRALALMHLAIHDALKVLTIPVVEVHLSNPGNREEFRHKSLVSPAASGVIAGFGPLGYRLAIEAAVALAAKKKD